MAHFDHTFGIEIECYLPEGQTRQTLATAINARLGAGSCEVEVYGHTTPQQWKIITDGSLGDYTSGVEIVSPVLINQQGIDAVKTVCRALTDFGCIVKRSCGFHVHVGVGNASLGFWKNLTSLYSVFEPVIDRMMPASRRANSNNYCLAMTSVAIHSIQQTTSFMALQRLYNSRFHKVNLQAYSRHRTVEFRQHSGTCDAEKASNWVLTCLKMVDLAKRETFNHLAFGASRPRNMAKRNTKNFMVGEMLLRPEGVTSAEALTATGWTTISVPEIARICGIGFTSQKRGRITRYFAVQGTSTSVSVETFASTISLDDDERAYITRRTNDLSGNVAWAA